LVDQLADRRACVVAPGFIGIGIGIGTGSSTGTGTGTGTGTNTNTNTNTNESSSIRAQTRVRDRVRQHRPLPQQQGQHNRADEAADSVALVQGMHGQGVTAGRSIRAGCALLLLRRSCGGLRVTG